MGISSAEWVERLSKLSPEDTSVAKVLSELRREYEDAENERLLQEIERALSQAEAGIAPDLTFIIKNLELMSMLEGRPISGASAEVRRILSNPVYRDVDDPVKANWIGRALNRLTELFTLRPGRISPSSIREPAHLNLGGLFQVLISVLAAALVVALFLAFRKTTFRKSKERKRAILQEDEPLRTFDEWLEMARRLQAEGRYREAIRCLYLAILMRLDKARIVRFDRAETNWEHLVRIEASSAPKDIDYRGVTAKFDYIWYGQHAATVADCDHILSEYSLLSERLKEAAV